MSSSSSSAAPLNRSRSLRQPTAGLNRAQKKDETGSVINTNNGAAISKGAAAAASTSSLGAARNTSPSRLPKPPGGPPIATRTRAGTAGKASSIPAAAAGTKSRPTSGIFGRADSIATRKPTTQATSVDPSTNEIDIHHLEIGANFFRALAHHPKPALSLEDDTTDDGSSDNFSGKNTITAHNHTYTRKVIRDRPKLRDCPAPTATAISRVGDFDFHNQYSHDYGDGCEQETKSAPSSNASALSRASSTNAARSVKPTAPGDAPRLKPAFNTLQQHYSPARNLAPKPLTSTYLAPPSPSKLPANIAISSETAKLQTELLQLHLLHRDADSVTASWNASAKQRLGQRFAELAGRDAEVSREEAEVEETRNLAALKAWSGSKGLDDKIQTLDSILSGVWSLGEPSGRYTRVVRKFEKWVDQTRQAVEARRLAGGLGALMEDDEVGFISELDPAWKDEVSSMARKLDSWRRQLGQLENSAFDDNQDKDQQPSSLERLLSGCRSQVHGMLAELDMMEQIERDTIAQETAWIRRMNRDDDENDTPRAGAIWRAF
ncbi:hypothetical protein J7T55_009625 [Diaporthe amygdali]|uniref:uncharacterized protein n=1 Tax=Phomopsis amygdali TaxID=1214568 RepID=UPI0022FEA63B|nr:uncharacterized protein J7T55_009625 [Diaporthe amygdali]KAJ0109293.1 hypothetical protein J7T55_009625 [Diaporthe amygdali]